jgi:hypothetical protein
LALELAADYLLSRLCRAGRRQLHRPSGNQLFVHHILRRVIRGGFSYHLLKREDGADGPGHADRDGAVSGRRFSPKTWEAPLAAKVTELGAAGDPDLLAAAQAVLIAAGRYNVAVHDFQGVQWGGHNVQVNRFGT